ncbi:MAG: hypothetical protein K0Q66_797 [Chitinophagaceae bacterium]|jgi:hypothetical protein|nr:hypothetical protein [Chitinophagaceae bacterium]
MKTIKFAAFLFYRYYSTGITKDIPYISTICALAMLTFMHLLQLLLVTSLYDIIMPSTANDPRIIGFLKMLIVAIPIFLFLCLLIREEELKRLKYTKEQRKKGYFVLIAYIIFTIVTLVLIAEITRGYRNTAYVEQSFSSA